MRRFSTLLAALIFSALFSRAERILETVLENVSDPQQNTIYNGELLIGGHGNSYLLIYNDEGFSRIRFPTVDGLQLKYSFSWNPLTHFESSLFFALAPEGTPFRPAYLYKYSSGRVFTRIPISGPPLSNCIVYGSYLYFLCDVSGTTKLFRYATGVVTEVTAGDIPRSYDYRLIVDAGRLYITGSAGAGRGTTKFLKRYVGGSFFTISSGEYGPVADAIFTIPGTERIYISSHRDVYYFDGRSLTQLFDNAAAVIFPKLLGNSLFFLAASGPTPTPGPTLFYKATGTTLTNISLPPGYHIPPDRNAEYPEIYRGSFYLVAYTTEERADILKYDGVSFSSIFTFPEADAVLKIRLLLKGDELIIHGMTGIRSSRTFSYNGIITEEIIAPKGYYLYLPGPYPGELDPLINSTACSHVWQIIHSERGTELYAYAKESRGCPVPPPPPPPPPPPGPVAVIPVDFMIHERFEGVAIGKDRGWCWNEIIFGWDPPVCDPPCPEPNYQLIMAGENNEIAWTEKFSKPSKFLVPLKDEKPFKTILSSIDNKSDLLIFAPDLVPKGIEEIKLFMLPKKNFITISVSTRKKEAVPLRIALLDENGKEIWMQTFVAPFEMQITATLQKPGKTLVFSIPDDGAKFVTHRSP